MGGTRQFFHFARHADFDTFAKPAAAPADADDQFVIATPHIMKEGKKFNQMYLTSDTGELESGSNGEIDGKLQADVQILLSGFEKRRPGVCQPL